MLKISIASGIRCLLFALAAGGPMTTEAQSFKAGKPVPILLGSEIRNGGDVLKCTGQDGSGHLFNLDYVLFRPQRQALPGNLQASLSEIQQQLDQKLPGLGASLRDYLSYLNFETTDYGNARVWERSFSLLPLDRPGELDLLSSLHGCGGLLRDTAGVELLQTIIRRHNTATDTIIYTYDVQTLNALDPLQQSFLVVHEWLWDFFDPTQVNALRAVNSLLHSDDGAALSPAELWDSFRRLGFPKEVLGRQPSPQPPMTLGMNYLNTCLQRGPRLECFGQDERQLQPPSAIASQVLTFVLDSSFLCLQTLDLRSHCYFSLTFDGKPFTMPDFPKPVRLASTDKGVCAYHATGLKWCSEDVGSKAFLAGHRRMDGVALSNSDACIIADGGLNCNFWPLGEQYFRGVTGVAIGSGREYCLSSLDSGTLCGNASGSQLHDAPTGLSGLSVSFFGFCGKAPDDTAFCWAPSAGLSGGVKQINGNPVSDVKIYSDRVCAVDDIGLRCWQAMKGPLEIPDHLTDFENGR